MIRSSGNLEQKMETFLATGNAPSNNVNLAQYKGLTIVAENINRMRYMSHFKWVIVRWKCRYVTFLFVNCILDTREFLGRWNGSSCCWTPGYRYVTHMNDIRSIHRGSFFMEMRTTEARQLLPDAWGFVCPVHTPDGAPCGLLNHLTMTAQVFTERAKVFDRSEV